MADLDNRIDELIENVAELLTNTVNMASVFYDIFLDPHPKYVDLQMFDNNNQLITVTIPNRAQDRENNTISGEGNPNGVQPASIGTVYIDTLTSTVYYKVSGEATDTYGWSPLLSFQYMNTFLNSYLEQHNYMRRSAFNTALSDSIKNGEIAISGSSSIDIKASNSDYGVVKVDNETIQWPEGSQDISTVGIRDNNTNVAKKIWIGKFVTTEEGEASYSTLETVDSNTIYILTDTGQILIGDTQVACNAFPSSTKQELIIGNSGDSYTAPANGWFVLSKTAGVANTKIEMKNNTTDYITTLYLPTASTSKGSIVCPALKGEEVVVTYDGTTKQSDTLIFINANANGTNSTNEVPQGE